MNRNTLILVGVLIILGIGSFAATRMGRRSPHCAGCEAPVAFAALQDYLLLSNAQRSAMQEIDARFSVTRPKLSAETYDARDELLKALQNPDSTPEQTLAATRRFCRAQEALQLNTVEYMIELRAHLSPTQKTKMSDLIGRGMCSLTGGPCKGHGMGGGMGLGLGRRSGGNPNMAPQDGTQQGGGRR